MFVIGIDPHKRVHQAVVVDEGERVLAQLRVTADRNQRARLLGFAERFEPRTWAVEGANGHGALLAQQLVAAGETVVDVPAKLSSRVRLLDSEQTDKNDSHDARAAAIVGLRNRRLRVVTVEDHTVVLRMLAKRHHDLAARRTQSICRLHAVLSQLVAGGLPRNLSAARASAELHRIRTTDSTVRFRREIAIELLREVRLHDLDLAKLRGRIETAVAAADTTVTDIYGVGPIVAAYLIGYTGDVARFPSAGHYARYNGTAPVDASTGTPTGRHRLNRRGNRQLNHAIHMAAVTQISRDTPGRAYYLAKLEQKKRDKDAMRALKRRISDAVYRHLLADAAR